MATTLRIDEINAPQFDSEAYIQQYFKPMRISRERKEEREEASKDFRDALLFLFALIMAYSNFPPIDWKYIERQYRMDFERAALRHARNTDALQGYIDEKTADFISITRDKDLSDPYWTSEERATMEAVNDANDVVGYEEWQTAIEEGKTHKIWKTERDNRVRHSHRAVDGKKLPITEMFVVGDSLMRFPHDTYYGTPAQTVNCRCSCEYIGNGGNKSNVDSIDAESEESRKGQKGNVAETQINRERLKHDVLVNRYAVLGEDEETVNILADRSTEILNHRNRTHYEDLAFVDPITHTSKINKKFDYYDEENRVSKCEPSAEMERMLENTPKGVMIGVHNHPSSSVPSLADVVKAYQRKYKYSLVVGHNGYIFKLKVRNLKSYTLNSIENRLADYEEALYNNQKELENEAIKELNGYGVFVEVIP